MTSPTPSTPIEAMRALRKATAAVVEDERDTLIAALLGKVQDIFDGMATPLLKKVDTHFDTVDEIRALTNDPRAALLAFNSNSVEMPNFEPVAGLGASTSNGTPAPTPDNQLGTSTLTPEQQLLLSAFENVPAQVVRSWADWARRSQHLGGDTAQGFPHMVEDVLDGKLSIDKLGEPKANSEVKKLNREIDALERERDDLQKKLETAEKELEDEKNKPAPIATSVDNDFRDAVVELIQTYYKEWTGKPIVFDVKDVEAIKRVISAAGDGMPAHILQAVKDFNDWRRAAENRKALLDQNRAAAQAAKTALAKVTTSRFDAEVHGRKAVQDELDKIDPPAGS